MKRLQLLFLGAFFLLSNSLLAQRDRVEYLPSFDKRKLWEKTESILLMPDFKIDYKTSNYTNANISVTATSGFNVGLIADLRLHKNINLLF